MRLKTNQFVSCQLETSRNRNRSRKHRKYLLFRLGQFKKLLLFLIIINKILKVPFLLHPQRLIVKFNQYLKSTKKKKWSKIIQRLEVIQIRFKSNKKFCSMNLRGLQLKIVLLVHLRSTFHRLQMRLHQFY